MLASYASEFVALPGVDLGRTLRRIEKKDPARAVILAVLGKDYGWYGLAALMAAKHEESFSNEQRLKIARAFLEAGEDLTAITLALRWRILRRLLRSVPSGQSKKLDVYR